MPWSTDSSTASHTITLKGDGYRLKDEHEQPATTDGTHETAQNSTGVDRE